MNYRKLVASLVCLLLSISIPKTIHAEGNALDYSSNGIITFEPNLDIEPPVDPDNPENEVKPVPPNDKPTEPGTKGPLGIDFASSLRFGVNKISNRDEVYYAKAQSYSDNKDTANYVQVTDDRGVNTGWSLTLKQEGQFTSEQETEYKELSGAELAFTAPYTNCQNKELSKPITNANIHLNPDGSEDMVMDAKDKCGTGTWTNAWGEVEEIKHTGPDDKVVPVNITRAVTLSVFGTTPKDNVVYKTKLKWTLRDVPTE